MVLGLFLWTQAPRATQFTELLEGPPLNPAPQPPATADLLVKGGGTIEEILRRRSSEKGAEYTQDQHHFNSDTVV